MLRLFVGNFDFEHRLAYGDGALPRRLEEINTALAPTWIAIAEAGDAVWTTSSDAPALFDRLESVGLPPVRAVGEPSELREPCQLVFWGENTWAAQFAARLKAPWSGCDPAIVRRVNSRCYKQGLEKRLGILLSGAAITRSAEELIAAIDDCHRTLGWVLKGEYGGAGREVRFCAGELSSSDLAWAAKRFRRGLAVTVEPRLDAIDEAGVQFEISPDGVVTLLGITPLMARRDGGYLGSSFIKCESLFDEWHPAIETARSAATLVAAEGYFGPLGIDAMKYRDSAGTIRFRALQDLNARYTMGRLALGLKRFPEFAERCGGIFRPTDFASGFTRPSAQLL